LTAASGPWGGGFVIYNTAGDITRKQFGTQNVTYSYAVNGKLNAVAGAGLQGGSYSYDTYGNVNTRTGGWDYDYNAAGNLDTLSQGSSTIREYSYDGLNNRVATVKNGVTTAHIYTKDGLLIADHADSNGAVQKEYAYLNDKLIASVLKQRPASEVSKSLFY